MKIKQGKPVDATLYRCMIGSLMYLTSSRPDLNYVVCLCARAQFLGDKLVSWSSKKQKCTAISSKRLNIMSLSGSWSQIGEAKTTSYEILRGRPTAATKNHMILSYDVLIIKNQRDLPRDILLDSVVVLRYEKRSKSENKGKLTTDIELVLEQTQQGSSYEVSVSDEGVEELKRKVKINGEKKEALLTLRQKPVTHWFTLIVLSALRHFDNENMLSTMNLIHVDPHGFEDSHKDGLGGQSKPVDKSLAKVAAARVSEVTKQTAGTETRRNIYLGLIGLINISLIDSFISPSFDWRKGAVLGVILVGLVTQLTYEQKMLGETQKNESEDKQDKKE
ncbi:hypothetical protein Tco_0536225 [Tanacetum coccineum]